MIGYMSIIMIKDEWMKTMVRILINYIGMTKTETIAMYVAKNGYEIWRRERNKYK